MRCGTVIHQVERPTREWCGCAERSYQQSMSLLLSIHSAGAAAWLASSGRAGDVLRERPNPLMDCAAAAVAAVIKFTLFRSVHVTLPAPELFQPAESAPQTNRSASRASTATHRQGQATSLRQWRILCWLLVWHDKVNSICTCLHSTHLIGRHSVSKYTKLLPQHHITATHSPQPLTAYPQSCRSDTCSTVRPCWTGRVLRTDR